MHHGDEVYILDDCSRKGSRERMDLLIDSRVRRIHHPLSVYPPKLFKGFEAIIHLAAQTAVTRSFVDPIDDCERNTLATLTLLEMVRQRGKPYPKVIFTSTNKVYGCIPKGRHSWGFDGEFDERKIPTSEACFIDLETPYGVSKGAADYYMRDYAKQFGIPTIILRCSCMYGPHQTAETDQGWIAYFADCMLNKQPITIYGTGEQVRDVLHISDLMTLLDALLERDTEPGEVFNVGGGPDHAISVMDAINLLGEISGIPIVYDFADWRPSDQIYYVSDILKIKEHTGWQPKMPPRDGFADIIRWMRSNT